MKPSEIESQRVLDEIRVAIRERKHFLLDAGAGAGKTYSLVQTLKYILTLPSAGTGHQQVACITYTNVARDEIKRRVDNHPRVFVSTIHGFAWELMQPFQQTLREIMRADERWQQRQEKKAIGIDRQVVRYSFGFYSISESHVSLGHDDVIKIFGRLLGYHKFRRVIVARYPYLLIDEYQDTNRDLMTAIQENLIERSDDVPTVGLFGDHWQQIYPGVCGKVEHPRLKVIEKGVNFRSAPEVVAVINRMRSQLTQVADRDDAVGQTVVFHTNNVDAERLVGGHWTGDLIPSAGQQALESAKSHLEKLGWSFEGDDTKVLMLTHRLLARQQGYESLPDVYEYNDVFRNLDDPYLYYFVEVLEPALDAYKARRFGEMYETLGGGRPAIRRTSDKAALAGRLDELVDLRGSATVGEVVDYISRGDFPPLSAELVRREEKLAAAVASGEDLGKTLATSLKLREIPYSEIIAFTGFHSQAAPYATKHGVKGAEFDNVLVVAGRGWSNYNFGDMLNRVAGSDLEEPSGDQRFVRNRNLFYVSCTRARNRLAVLFTQELSAKAISHLHQWFGESNIVDVAEGVEQLK